MQATLKFIQTVRFVLGGAVVWYFFVILRIRSSATPNPVLLRALGVVAISQTIVMFVARRLQVIPAKAVLETQPEDKKALARLRIGCLITYTLCQSIALYGLLLHFFGFSIPQITPFFLAGIVPILFFGPTVRQSNASSSHPDPIVPR